MKKKWLGITLALLVVVAAVAALVVFGNTKADAADGVQFTVKGTKFGLNDPIEVTITGLTEEMRTHDIEIRLENDIVPVDATPSYRTNKTDYIQYFDIGSDARDEAGNLIDPANLSETRTVTFQNGGRRHPTSGGTVSMKTGYLSIWIIDFKTGTVLGTPTTILVGDALEISVDKTEFLVGEGIEVNVSGLSNLSSHKLEFRLEKATMDGYGYTYRKGYLTWLNLGNNASDEVTGAKLPSEAFSDSRTVTFKNGNAYTPDSPSTKVSIPIEILMSERWNLWYVGETCFAEEEVGDFCCCHRSEHRADVDCHIEKAEAIVAEWTVFSLVVEVADHDLKVAFEETCSYRDESEC